MKINTSASAPRLAGVYTYQVDRSALIGLFAAGVIIGMVTLRAIYRRQTR